MEVIGFVPLRSGSKGIKDKNICLIAGKPLVYWVLNALQNSLSISQIFVAIDSKKFANIVKSFHFSKVKIYTRSDENAADTSPTIDVVTEFLNNVNIKDTSHLLIAQATSPLLRSYNVDEFVKKYAEAQVAASFSCVEFPRICWSLDGTPILHNPQKRKRRQEGDKILVENGAMYICNVEKIKQNKAFLYEKSLPYIMPYNTLTEIDNYEDIPVVEQILKKQIKPEINKFKAFLMDCDGTLTDGGMYYSENGETLKKFNTTDGAGISLLKKTGIYIAIITAEDTDFAKERAKKLGIDCYSSIQNKLDCLNNIAKKINCSLSEIIYMGDDLNDLEAIKSAGYSACPKNAQDIVKTNVNYISCKNGGEGAVRDVINFLLC